MFVVRLIARKLRSAVALAAVAGGIAALATSGSVQSSIQAKRANDFLGSMGINVHMGSANTPYADTAEIYTALRALGMRHFRDEINDTHPQFVAKLKGVGDLGYTLCGLIEGGNDYPAAGSSLDASAVVPMIENLRPFIEAVEGPNEPDDPATPPNQPFAYGPSGEIFPQGAIQESEDLWSIVHGSAAISDLPVLAMSEGNPHDFTKLAAATQTPFGFANFGNLHAYQGGGVADSGLSAYIHYAAKFTGNERLWVTEMGYHNNTNFLSDGEQQGVSPRASAIYLPSAFLSAFNAGIVQTFSYELIDETSDPDPTSSSGGEGHYGLLNFNFTPKPAFTALHNLISILQDSGSAGFTPGLLPIAFEGAPASMRYTLLEKSNGDFYLALWNNVSVYQTATSQAAGEDQFPSNVQITIRFATPQTFTVYAPNDPSGANPTDSYTDSVTSDSLEIELPPQVLLIKIAQQ